MIEENQVTIKKLIEIFEAAYMEVANIQEATFTIKGTQSAWIYIVKLDTDRKKIHFIDYTRLQGITLENAAILCNEANKDRIIARFYSFLYLNAVTVTCQYDMSFEKGVIPFQIISNFRIY
jgi:hypothetical protein